MVYLRTFGVLSLQGVTFGREKPLLLLAYLSLNGPQPRRTVARLFWPDASNAMNSLSVALGQLRKVLPDHLQVTDTQVGTSVACDALDVQRALREQDLQAAQRQYQGPFVADLSAEGIGEALEEWVLHTREQFADAYRELLLIQARTRLAVQPAEAGTYAALAHTVSGATSPTPETYRELHALLRAAGHPQAVNVARQAANEGVPLPDAGPRSPIMPLLGRQGELQRLLTLSSGDVLWVRGAPGLGKTALLRAAALHGGTFLRGRSGQAFLTMQPLRQEPLNEQAWFSVLTQHQTPLLIDDWDSADPESRRLLLLAARSRACGPLVLASRGHPPAAFPELVLAPVAEGLSPDLLVKTGGIPALLHALEHGQCLADAYAHLLASQSPRARQLLICLSLVPSAPLSAIQTALEVRAEAMADMQEALRGAALLRHQEVTAPAALRAWLDTQPSLETEVLALLTPHLGVEDAFPLYLRMHHLTGDNDVPGFQPALGHEARRLIRQGHDVQARDLLVLHARTPENQLLLARAQDSLGHYPDALKTLSPLETTPLVAAYLGRVLFRLGRLDDARQAAQAALNGDLEAKAQAYNLLNALALTAQDYAAASAHAERAAGLFLLLGDATAQLRMRCMQAIAHQKAHRAQPLQSPAPGLADLIDAAASEPLVPADVLLNIGWLLEEQGALTDALRFATQAAHRAEEVQDLINAASAWNNVGVLHHKQAGRVQAAAAYRKAIELARHSGATRLLALALGNLAELQESLPLIEEALSILEGSGQDDLVEYFQAQQAMFRGRSGGE